MVVAVEDALAELALVVVVVVAVEGEPPVPPPPELEELDEGMGMTPEGVCFSPQPVPTRPKNTSRAMRAQPEQREAFMAQPFCQR